MSGMCFHMSVHLAKVRNLPCLMLNLTQDVHLVFLSISTGQIADLASEGTVHLVQLQASSVRVTAKIMNTEPCTAVARQEDEKAA